MVVRGITKYLVDNESKGSNILKGMFFFKKIE